MSSRLIRGGLAAAATAGLAATVTTAPAQAASGYDRCPAGKLCVFQYGDFKGKMEIISSSRPTLGIWNNSISSLVNNSDLYVSLTPESNYEGESYLIDPHTPPNDLTGGSLGRRWDNTISSIRVATTKYEATLGVPWMDWFVQDQEKRPAGLPAVAQFGDMDNDNHPDLLERADDGRLWFLSGVGDANWATKGKLVGGGWNSMTQLVRHGDYNSDGKEDVYARDRSGVLWSYPGRGDGAFKDRVKVGGGWNSMREISAAGDLTGDGRRDLLARDTAGTLWLYPGNGRGTFGDRKLVGGGWNAMNQLAAPGDLNGDGRADLLARDGSRTLWLYPGNGQGNFGARTKLPYAWSADAPVLATGDVNGDGISDIMRPMPIVWQLHIYHGTGRGGVGGPSADMYWDTAPNVRVF
ncbi:FG-GAP-like repeat-containing protein [Streptomyces sp. BPTC-684]|uniref:FG-GAP-like repeat-containing protein n=1 Tax=Streptomyces sp. BPTC-684 TaxID=3043734 RepID=UPI0024B06D1B|nr:FG-GAP-like repeat-containing protein [Streptomyces sp. BPTC-684]WHM36905.1 FG-GAP-like repeat-containing protein [Streptomyces sp. BPTC-684]